MLTSIALDAGCAGLDAAETARMAARVDQAGVDMLMLGGQGQRLDPLVVAGWLAPALTYTALVVTVPALHSRPFHVARALSALDILSRGRSGWAPSTLGHVEQAARIGPAAETAAQDAYPKALDFIAATQRLWESWDTDALVIDKALGVYLNPARVRRVDYRGPYFQVMGPLNAARPLQGFPVLVQRDDDPLWWLTADQADVLMVTAPDRETVRARRAEVAAAGGCARLLAEVEIDAGQPVGPTLEALRARLGTGAVDGVHLVANGPTALAAVVDHLAGAARGELAGGMLKSRLGLPDPAAKPARARA